MTLYIRDESGSFSAATSDQIVSEALTVTAAEIESTDLMTNPVAVKNFLAVRMANLEYEVFAVMFLTNRHQVIKFDVMFRGTIDGASVYPREVAKAALQYNAAAVVIAHNHPSGITQPSQADELITRKLRDALSMFDIRVLDHVIVGGKNSFSFAEHGLL